MAWIEAHEEIWEHHKLIKLCSLLKKPDYAVVGHLQSLWHFTLRNAWLTANLEPWGEAGIEKCARWDGPPGLFVSSLRDCKFLDGYIIHNWLDFCGDLVLKKINYEDKKQIRLEGIKRNIRDFSENSQTFSENSQTFSENSHPTKPNLTKPNLTKTHTVPSKGDHVTSFEAFWGEYPRKKGKKEALKAWIRARPNLQVCLKSLEVQKQSKQWTKDNGEFIPMPAKWINGARWDDEAQTEERDYIVDDPKSFA